MSVCCIDDRPVVHTLEEFESNVRELATEKSVVDYVKSHHLEFLKMGEAIKIRKKEKRHPNPNCTNSDRSKYLSRSLMVFANGMIVGTGHWRVGSVPGGAEAVLLGQGADKVAYKVRELSSGLFVAISVATQDIHFTVEAGGAVTHRFSAYSLQREYELTQLIQSPHILPIQCYAVRHKEEVIKGYTVSELCEGTLADKIENEDDYLQQHPQHLQQIRSALDACHAIGITHNDLFTGNIFLKNGHAVLADFGMARHVGFLLFEPTTVWASILQKVGLQMATFYDDICFKILQESYELAALTPVEAFLNKPWYLNRVVRLVGTAVRSMFS